MYEAAARAMTRYSSRCAVQAANTRLRFVNFEIYLVCASVYRPRFAADRRFRRSSSRGSRGLHTVPAPSPPRPRLSPPPYFVESIATRSSSLPAYLARLFSLHLSTCLDVLSQPVIHSASQPAGQIMRQLVSQSVRSVSQSVSQPASQPVRYVRQLVKSVSQVSQPVSQPASRSDNPSDSQSQSVKSDSPARPQSANPPFPRVIMLVMFNPFSTAKP